MDQLDAVLDRLTKPQGQQQPDSLDAILGRLVTQPKQKSTGALEQFTTRVSNRLQSQEDLGMLSSMAQENPAEAAMLAENMGYGTHPLTRAIRSQAGMPQQHEQGVFFSPEERQAISDAVFGSQVGRLGAAAASGVLGFGAKFESDPTRTYQIQEEIARRSEEGAKKAGYGELARTVEQFATGGIQNLVQQAPAMLTGMGALPQIVNATVDTFSRSLYDADKLGMSKAEKAGYVLSQSIPEFLFAYIGSGSKVDFEQIMGGAAGAAKQSIGKAIGTIGRSLINELGEEQTTTVFQNWLDQVFRKKAYSIDDLKKLATDPKAWEEFKKDTIQTLGQTLFMVGFGESTKKISEFLANRSRSKYNGLTKSVKDIVNELGIDPSSKTGREEVAQVFQPEESIHEKARKERDAMPPSRELTEQQRYRAAELDAIIQNTMPQYNVTAPTETQSEKAQKPIRAIDSMIGDYQKAHANDPEYEGVKVKDKIRMIKERYVDELIDAVDNGETISDDVLGQPILSDVKKYIDDGNEIYRFGVENFTSQMAYKDFLANLEKISKTESEATDAGRIEQAESVSAEQPVAAENAGLEQGPTTTVRPGGEQNLPATTAEPAEAAEPVEAKPFHPENMTLEELKRFKRPEPDRQIFGRSSFNPGDKIDLPVVDMKEPKTIYRVTVAENMIIPGSMVYLNKEDAKKYAENFGADGARIITETANPGELKLFAKETWEDPAEYIYAPDLKEWHQRKIRESKQSEEPTAAEPVEQPPTRKVESLEQLLTEPVKKSPAIAVRDAVKNSHDALADLLDNNSLEDLSNPDTDVGHLAANKLQTLTTAMDNAKRIGLRVELTPQEQQLVDEIERKKDASRISEDQGAVQAEGVQREAGTEARRNDLEQQAQGESGREGGTQETIEQRHERIMKSSSREEIQGHIDEIEKQIADIEESTPTKVTADIRAEAKIRVEENLDRKILHEIHRRIPFRIIEGGIKWTQEQLNKVYDIASNVLRENNMLDREEEIPDIVEEVRRIGSVKQRDQQMRDWINEEAQSILNEKNAPATDMLEKMVDEASMRLDYMEMSSEPTTASESDEYGKTNKIVDQDAYDAAKDRLKKSRGEMRAGVNPRDFADLLTIGAYHFEAGLRTFAAWSERMVKEFGDAVKPHLQDIWDRIKQHRDQVISEDPIVNHAAQIETVEQAPNAAAEIDENVAYLMDQWLGDRQLAETEAHVRAQNHRDALIETMGLKRFDDKAKQADMAMLIYIDLLNANAEGVSVTEKVSELFGKLNKEQQAILEMALDLPPNIKALADKIIAENKRIGQQAVSQEVIRNAKENYAARLWRPVKGKQEGMPPKFGTKTARSKGRVYESILDGWAQGRELAVQGAIESQLVSSQQVSQVVHDRNLINTGLRSGILSMNEEEGFEKVEHPNFIKWRYAGSIPIDPNANIEEGSWVVPKDRRNIGRVVRIEGNKVDVFFKNKKEGTEKTVTFDMEDLEKRAVNVKGKNFFVTEDGSIMEKVPLYAPKKLATSLNNILGQSSLYKVPGFKWLTKWNAILKHTVLTTSLFHHQAFLRSYMFASKGLDPKAGFNEGKQAVKNFIPELKTLVRNGLTLGKIQDIDFALTKEKTVIGNIIDKIPVASWVKSKLTNMMEQQTDYLFNRLGTYLKSQAALLEYRSLLKRHDAALMKGEMTHDDIAKMAANIINDDFGGLNLQRMQRNPTAQHIFRLLALAPDWTESNVRTMTKAFIRGNEGHVYRAMWGRVAIKALTATVLANLLMAAFDDEDDFFDRYEKAWKEGKFRWMDVDVTPIYRMFGGTEKRKYFSLIGHFRDPVKFLVHPITSAKHKGSILSRAFFEALTGVDWADRPFTTTQELLGVDKNGKYKGSTVTNPWKPGHALDYNQIPSFLIHQAKSFMPIQLQNGIDFLNGEIDLFDAITRGAGLQTFTTYPKKKKGAKNK